MLRIIIHETKSKFQLTIGIFSIAFVMSVIEKFAEFLNTLKMKYELQNICWINTVVMIQYIFVDYSTSRILLRSYSKK